MSCVCSTNGWWWRQCSHRKFCTLQCVSDPNKRHSTGGRLRLKCDGTRAETRVRLSAKRTSPFKSEGASVQSISGSRGVRISGSNAGYTMFRDSVKCTGYPLHSPVSPSLPLPRVTVCHHISIGLYSITLKKVDFTEAQLQAHVPWSFYWNGFPTVPLFTKVTDTLSCL